MARNKNNIVLVSVVSILITLILIAGGAGIFYIYKMPSGVQTCSPEWECSSWGDCHSATVGSLQERTCTDSNNCGVETDKPDLIQSCTSQCSPNWNCSLWSNCINNKQTRDCKDSNKCGITTGIPNESQECSSSCIPNWVTGSWSACSGGAKTRTVSDSNKCGITTGKPSESITCTIGANENYLIITTNSLANSPSINNLKTLRSEYNIITKYVDGMTPEQIKNVITTTNSDASLDYIVVIGSETQIPTGVGGEYYYSDMNNDGTPDVAYGRIPFSKETNLASLINKEMVYENNQYYETHKKKILLMAGDEAVPATGFRTATFYEQDVIPQLNGWTITKAYYGCGYSECMIPLNSVGNWGCDKGKPEGAYEECDIEADKITLGKMNDILFMGFIGHGDWFPNVRFPSLPTFNFGEVKPYLNNKDKYFILNLQSCSGVVLSGDENTMFTSGIGNTGNFAITLLAYPDMGTVATIGSVISNGGQQAGFYGTIKTEKTLGKAWLKGNPNQQYAILGDPALTINA